MVEKVRGEFAAGAGEELFDLNGGVLELAVVIAGSLALLIIPVRDSMQRRVFLGPCGDGRLQFRRDILKRHASVTAVLADESAFHDVAGEEREQRRAAAFSFAVRRRGRGEALVPNLAVMSHLRAEPVGAEQGMRQPPGAAFELAEGLGQPAGEAQVVEVVEDLSVFLPQFVERRVGVTGHVGQG